MFGKHYYHESITKTVAVFGTLFNDINLVRKDKDGNVLNIIRVPLAYGSRERFTTLANQYKNNDNIRTATKLPIMSFDITGFTHNNSVNSSNPIRKIKNNQESGNTIKAISKPVTYDIGFELSIYSKTQSDMLQIVEQILPNFNPQYTVTIKQVDDNFSTDIPFIFEGIGISNSYEGDYNESRTIIYTLSFTATVRLYSDYKDLAIIKNTKTKFYGSQNNTSFLSGQDINIDPLVNSREEPHDTIIDYVSLTPAQVHITLNNIEWITKNLKVRGKLSGSIGTVTSIEDDNVIVLDSLTGNFIIGEEVEPISEASKEVSEILQIDEKW